MAHSPINTTTFKEADNELFYAVELPENETAIPLSFYTQTQNIYGQYAKVEKQSDGTYIAVRDALGIGKLFYTEDADGMLHFSAQFRDLLPHKTPIFAVPRGQCVRLAPGARELINTVGPAQTIVPDWTGSQLTTTDAFENSNEGRYFQTALANRMDAAFTVLQRLEENGYHVFIALSGGLDSSIIATLAKKHLKNPIACTLDLGRSEDAEKSALISRVIDIEQEVFETSEDEILAAVNESPVACQDYRDFNVHCTALNLLLAKNIQHIAEKKTLPPYKAIVLTGDTMNEFTVDYHAEEVDGTTYYRLPRVNPKMLQRMLIGGLDTSDRELLPFKTHQLSCIQPFAIAYDLYLSLPEPLFEIDDIKRTLNGHLVPEKVLDLLPKSKLRAQVGSKESMGVLGLCHHRGIDETAFLKQLLGSDSPQKKLVPITMGRYETETFE